MLEFPEDNVPSSNRPERGPDPPSLLYFRLTHLRSATRSWEGLFPLPAHKGICICHS